MKKLCQVVMLPTKKAKIHKHNVNNILITSVENTEASKLYNTTPQHLYFLSDEEIKVGDWIYDTITKKIEIAKFNHDVLKRDWKKIIATTDESLSLVCTCGALKKVPTGLCIKCGKFINTSIPRPSNEFIKKYCELGGINEVMVQYEDYLINPLTEQEVSITDTIAAEDLDTGYRLKEAPDNTITIYPKK